MRKSIFLLAIVGLTSFMLAGCSTNKSAYRSMRRIDMQGPERKLGRGINNFMEIARGGEIRRSMEQTAIFGNPDVAYSTGFIHGFNRSMARMGVGLYEIFTFPIPNGPGRDYGPIYLPENPVYPDSYKPGVLADQMFATDQNLGFSGGEIAPMVPGSRFSIFGGY